MYYGTWVLAKNERGCRGSDEVVPLTKPATVDVVDQLHLLAKRVMKEVVKMVEKKKVKKVQVSIPLERYEEIEKMWIGLGFSSVAEAARFLVMNNVADFYKQVKKSQTAITRLQELKKKSSAVIAPVQSQGKTLSATKQQTSGYIEKGTFEYKRIVADWQKQNPQFVEPIGVKGLRWWIDEKTKRKNIGWWKHGSK